MGKKKASLKRSRGTRKKPGRKIVRPTKAQIDFQRKRERVAAEYRAVEREAKEREIARQARAKRLSPATIRKAQAYADRIAGRAAPPRGSPKSPRFSDNKNFRTHRGYYFRDSLGRWRTPDGKMAPGQRLIEVARNGRTRREYVSKTAQDYNAKHGRRLLKEDAYVGMIASGAVISRKEFNALTKNSGTRAEIGAAIGREYGDEDWYDDWFDWYDDDGGDTP